MDIKKNNSALLSDGQIAKALYLKNMAAMKEILTLEEMRLGGRDSDVYKYFRKVVMDQIYGGLSDIFAAMEKEGILRKCDCMANIRKGYKPCPLCNGAGHCNTDQFNDLLTDMRVNAFPKDEPSN